MVCTLHPTCKVPEVFVRVNIYTQFFQNFFGEGEGEGEGEGGRGKEGEREGEGERGGRGAERMRERDHIGEREEGCLEGGWECQSQIISYMMSVTGDGLFVFC